jgi:hypothetical protein
MRRSAVLGSNARDDDAHECFVAADDGRVCGVAEHTPVDNDHERVVAAGRGVAEEREARRSKSVRNSAILPIIGTGIRV